MHTLECCVAVKYDKLRLPGVSAYLRAHLRTVRAHGGTGGNLLYHEGPVRRARCYSMPINVEETEVSTLNTRLGNPAGQETTGRGFDSPLVRRPQLELHGAVHAPGAPCRSKAVGMSTTVSRNRAVGCRTGRSRQRVHSRHFSDCPARRLVRGGYHETCLTP